MLIWLSIIPLQVYTQGNNFGRKQLKQTQVENSLKKEEGPSPISQVSTKVMCHEFLYNFCLKRTLVQSHMNKSYQFDSKVKIHNCCH